MANISTNPVALRPFWPWFHDWKQRRKSAEHQRRITRQLRRHVGEPAFQIVLKSGEEFKLPENYQIDGGILRFTHHSGEEKDIAIERIARATSKADH